jgi:hypothetical protein
MDKRYRELFTLISQSVSNLAEQVMNDHQDKGEDKQQETAQIMRDDYSNLHDKLVNEEELNKADFARLLVGAIIVTNQLDARIKNEQKALDGYKVDVIPKLDRINNTEEEEVASLAEELFKIQEEKKSDEKE